MCRCIRGNRNWNEHNKEKRKGGEAKLGRMNISVMKAVPLAESLVLTDEHAERLEELKCKQGAPANLPEPEQDEWSDLMKRTLVKQWLTAVGKLGDGELVRLVAEMASELESNEDPVKGVIGGVSDIGWQLQSIERGNELAKNVVLPAVKRLLSRTEVRESLAKLGKNDTHNSCRVWLMTEWAVGRIIDWNVPLGCRGMERLNPISENEIVQVLQKASGSKKPMDFIRKADDAALKPECRAEWKEKKKE